MSFCNPLVHISYIVVEISSTPTFLWGSLWFKILDHALLFCISYVFSQFLQQSSGVLR